MWAKSALSEEGDAIRELLLSDIFPRQEIDLREGALRAAAKFDMKGWKKLGASTRGAGRAGARGRPGRGMPGAGALGSGKAIARANVSLDQT